MCTCVHVSRTTKKQRRAKEWSKECKKEHWASWMCAFTAWHTHTLSLSLSLSLSHSHTHTHSHTLWVSWRGPTAVVRNHWCTTIDVQHDNKSNRSPRFCLVSMLKDSKCHWREGEREECIRKATRHSLRQIHKMGKMSKMHTVRVFRRWLKKKQEQEGKRNAQWPWRHCIRVSSRPAIRRSSSPRHHKAVQWIHTDTNRYTHTHTHTLRVKQSTVNSSYYTTSSTQLCRDSREKEKEKGAYFLLFHSTPSLYSFILMLVQFCPFTHFLSFSLSHSLLLLLTQQHSKAN